MVNLKIGEFISYIKHSGKYQNRHVIVKNVLSVLEQHWSGFCKNSGKKVFGKMLFSNKHLL